MPFLLGSLGHVSRLNTGWLRTAITSAASKAGYPGWWLAEDLATGISVYLRDNHPHPVIDRPHFERVVRGVLCDVGYGDVAVFFRTKVPSERISLQRCLPGSKLNDREEFFDVLAAQIVSLRSSPVAHVHFCDLQSCVRSLSQVSRSSGDHNDSLALEVVDFVRKKFQSVFQRQEVWCSIT